MLGIRLTRRRIDRQQLRAAHSLEFDSLLRTLHVDKLFRSRKARCKFCRDLIHDLDRVSAVFPESGAIQLVCAKPSCLLALAEFLTDRSELI
jgi:hypothetical protein